jgi:hypothetical protein
MLSASLRAGMTAVTAANLGRGAGFVTYGRKPETGATSNQI